MEYQKQPKQHVPLNQREYIALNCLKAIIEIDEPGGTVESDLELSFKYADAFIDLIIKERMAENG